MTSTINMEVKNDTILLCPDYIASSLIKHYKSFKKGTYVKLSYYIGFVKHFNNGYFSKEELEKIISEIESIKNTNLTLLEIDKKDLTIPITIRFRYIQKKVDYPEQPVLIDPYILGMWLGDGHSNGASLTNIDIPLIEAWTNYAHSINCKITTSKIKERKSKIEENQTSFVTSYNIVQKKRNSANCTNTLLNNLKKYNLIKNKHIPKEYLINSREIRLQVLAGLIDTDGNLSYQKYEISQLKPQLSKDIIELAQSLGFYTHYSIGEKSCMYLGTKRTGTYYRIIISLNQFTLEVPVLLKRKQWKYYGQSNIYNPSIDINGNIIKKLSTDWTEEMKIKLYSLVVKYKEFMPNKPIPWAIIGNLDNMFDNIPKESLLNIYKKTLLPEKEHYDMLIEDLSFLDVTDFIDEFWMNKYRTMKKLLDENAEISSKSNTYYYKWIFNQKQCKCPHKLRMINEIYDDFISRSRTCFT